jgi:rod shape-determining protein MreC
MLRRSHYVAAGAVLALLVVLFSLPEAALARLKSAVNSLFLPVFGLTAASQTVRERASAGLTPRSALLAERDQLRAQNRQLRLQAMQGEEALRENERLRSLLGWQKQSPWKLQPARVIARDPASWWRTVKIDRGARDGLRPSLPVLTAEGLIGKTGSVGPAIAEVILIGDPKCWVAVRVGETGELGMLSDLSADVLDHRLVNLTHLPRHSVLKAGQTVFTSGLGGVFPPGIPVGHIVDSRSVGYGLYTEARVRLAADTSRAQEVMVWYP